jgi:hypothetical protein
LVSTPIAAGACDAETSSHNCGPPFGPATRPPGDPLDDAGRIESQFNESKKLMFAHQSFVLRRKHRQSTIFALHFRILGDFLPSWFEFIAESEG